MATANLFKIIQDMFGDKFEIWHIKLDKHILSIAYRSNKQGDNDTYELEVRRRPEHLAVIHYQGSRPVEISADILDKVLSLCREDILK